MLAHVSIEAKVLTVGKMEHFSSMTGHHIQTLFDYINVRARGVHMMQAATLSGKNEFLSSC